MTNTRTAIPTPPYRMPRETRAPRTLRVPVSTRFLGWLLAAIVGGLIGALIGAPSHTDPSLSPEAASKTVAATTDCRTTGDLTCERKIGGDNYYVTFDKNLYVTKIARANKGKSAPKVIAKDCRKTGTGVCTVKLGPATYRVTFTKNLYVTGITRVTSAATTAEDGSKVPAGYYDRTSYQRPGAVWDGTAWVTK